MMRRLAVVVLLAALTVGCVSIDPYPLPGGSGARQTNPVKVGSSTQAVVLFMTPRAGDRIVLLGAEPVGDLVGAEVRFFFSPPVLQPDGDRTIGELLRPLEGAQFGNDDEISGPEDTVGIVAEVEPSEPGRYRLTAVRLRYRLNGSEERVGEGITVVLTVCADDPEPVVCDE